MASMMSATMVARLARTATQTRTWAPRAATQWTRNVTTKKPSMTGPTMVDLSKFATEEEQSKRLPHHAVLRDQELRKEHHAIRQSYPESAQPSEGPKVDAELAYRKRLLYRSKQRGWLEVDLLLGSWAADNIMSLSLEECAQFEAILNMETLDIYNMISGQMQVPEFLQTPIMEKLQKYCQSKPVGTADPTMYAKIKAKMSN